MHSTKISIHCNKLTILSKYSFHSSKNTRFPVSDYDIFWLRQPRKWDFIEFGNHPEMYPSQYVPYQNAKLLFARHIAQHKKRRPRSEDSFNRWWEVSPWEYDKIGPRVPCTLSTPDKGIIDFTLDRSRIDVINKDLRSRCTLYNLYIRSPQNLSLTPHQLIAESWKYYNNNNTQLDDTDTQHENSNYYLDRVYKNNELMRESTLTTKFVNHYQCFLRDIQKTMIFEDVETLHFEQYIPHKSINIIIPIRFYGLDQWFPVNRDGFYQWRAPRKNDRPRYIQHEWEIEFEWNGKNINEIPRHLSITVEQFCLPWKTEITLDDIKLPDYLTPLKHPSDIKILSLDFSKMHKKDDDFKEEEEEEEIDLLSANYGT